MDKFNINDLFNNLNKINFSSNFTLCMWHKNIINNHSKSDISNKEITYIENLLLSRDKSGHTLLMRALLKSNHKFYELLNYEGCTKKVLSACDNEGNNIIMLAAKIAHISYLNALLNHKNCPLDVFSPHFDRLAHAPEAWGLNQSFLFRNNFRPTNALSLAVIAQSIESVEMILSHRYFIRALLFERDWQNYNALDYVKPGNNYLKKILLNIMNKN